MTPHVIGLSPVLSTPYLATAAMDKCIRVHAASLRQLALPVIVVGPGKHDRSCFRSDCLPRLRSPATWLKIKCGDFLMQRGVSLISHHILNCGIFARFWRGRVQITADPEWHVRLRSEPAKVDNHDNHDVRVPIACCPWRVFARNLSCGSQRHPDQPLNGFLPRRARPAFSQRRSEKSRCAYRGSVHRVSLRPSSETHKFEHGEGERRANGAVKGDPGRRG